MWMNFQAVLQPCSSNGMIDKGLLECFYRGLGPENRGIADKLCEGGILQQPYEVVAKLLDSMVEANKEAKKKQEWDSLVTYVLSPEGKDQVGGKKEQLAHRREFLRSITMSPNDPEHGDAEGLCKTAMNYTKRRTRRFQLMSRNGPL
uniref:Uncharacterized protein n=1 Tax=Solanum tuberosum TaxID=4113 RepID=M1DXS2_SOLTU